MKSSPLRKQKGSCENSAGEKGGLPWRIASPRDLICLECGVRCSSHLYLTDSLNFESTYAFVFELP